MTHEISVNYRSDGISENTGITPERADHAVELLNRSASHRWEKLKMDSLIRKGLLDAALTGDAVFYSWWDNTLETGQMWKGDIALSLIDTRDLFVADEQCDDIQKQDYVIVRGSCPVERLRDEAKAWGLEGRELLKIVPDGDEKYEGERTYRDRNGRLKFRSGPEPKQDDQSPISPKCSFLVKFWRDENGFVRWEKSTRTQVIRKGETRMKLYPFAVMHWIPVRGSYHGESPVTSIIGNQKYINKAYAMAMKHMVDTAFSKVIYDRRLIPEWSNEVGQAIGVNAGGDVSNAVKTVGVGELMPNFTGILDQVISETKTLLGATETAIGESTLSNTSAIVALQEASEIPLDLIRHRLYQCVEDIANIWAEMVCSFYQAGRITDGTGESIDTDALRSAMIHAHVDVGAASRYSQILRVTTLDKLLDGGHITFAQYLERLPDGIISDRSGLLEAYVRAENA